MNRNNKEEKKCRKCGKTIVGNNKTGICAACKKKCADEGAIVLGVVATAGGVLGIFLRALRSFRK